MPEILLNICFVCFIEMFTIDVSIMIFFVNKMKLLQKQLSEITWI